MKWTVINLSEIRSEKLRELLKRNTTNSLRMKVIKEVEDATGIQLTKNNFLDIKKSQELAYLANKILDQIETKERIFDLNVIFSELNKLKSSLKVSLSDDVVLYFYEGRETGALQLRLIDVFNNLEFFLTYTKFTTGNEHLRILHPNLEHGICSVIYEGYYTFTSWGFK